MVIADMVSRLQRTFLPSSWSPCLLATPFLPSYLLSPTQQDHQRYITILTQTSIHQPIPSIINTTPCLFESIYQSKSSLRSHQRVATSCVKASSFIKVSAKVPNHCQCFDCYSGAELGMVVTMARSIRLTLLLLFIVTFLFSTATAVVTTETAVPTNEHDWSWFVAKDYFCSDNNPEVQNGCRAPGTCFYPVHFANLSRCDFYVQCVMDEGSLNNSKKTAKARLRSCGGSPESAEFSPLTRKCEPKGAEGTCSYYENWKRPEHWGRRLAARDHDLAIRDGPRGVILSTEWATKTFCKTNPEVNEGCKVKGGCKYSLYCGAYDECVMKPTEKSTTATAQFESCPRTMEFSSVTRRCETKGSPGTCSAKKQGHHLAKRAIDPGHRYQVSARVCSDPMYHPNGEECRKRT
jgi:hypothetical protein